MACFHLSVKTIGRGTGKSAVGAAAYRAGEKLNSINAVAYQSGEKIYNEQNKITHDYTRKSGVVHSEIMLPDHAPRECQDRTTLWNSVEKFERNSNARTAREVVVALPVELDNEQNIDLVRDYVKRNFVDEGMCADFSIHSGHIHDRKDEKYPFEDLVIKKNNPHAHIMLTVRPLNNDGSWGAKSKKEYILDKNGERIKLKSGEWKSRKIDATDWDKTETLIKWREDWARTTNNAYERLGFDERVDHRSLKAQGIKREPTMHMGVKAWNLEKKGIKTERGDKNRQIFTQNLEKNITKTAENMHELKERYFDFDSKILSEKSPRLVPERDKIKTEYQRQKLLAEINPNREKILEKLSELDKKSLTENQSARGNIWRGQGERILNNISDKEFSEVLKGIKPEQARELTVRREWERAREQERFRYR